MSGMQAALSFKTIAEKILLIFSFFSQCFEMEVWGCFTEDLLNTRKCFVRNSNGVIFSDCSSHPYIFLKMSVMHTSVFWLENKNMLLLLKKQIKDNLL